MNSLEYIDFTACSITGPGFVLQVFRVFKLKCKQFSISGLSEIFFFCARVVASHQTGHHTIYSISGSTLHLLATPPAITHSLCLLVYLKTPSTYDLQVYINYCQSTHVSLCHLLLHLMWDFCLFLLELMSWSFSDGVSNEF